MKILTMAAMIALPFMALGQTTEPQQQGQQTPAQTTETQPAAPAKAKKERPAQEQQGETKAKAETKTDVRGQTDVQRDKGRVQDVNRTQTEARSSTNQTNVKVNVQEFKSRHSEVFSLGRHPKEFFVQRFGATHFRLIGQTYFVFVDGCWVAVDVDGFVYTERVICAGDPEFVEVE